VRLVYAEVLKIRTAPRTTIGVLLALLGIAALGGGSTASLDEESPFEPETSTADILDLASVSVIFALILGILVVTWEYRHGTITSTFLATPRRERIIGAKILVGAVLGVLLAALSIAVSLVAASFWIDLDLARGEWEVVGRIIYGSAAWAVLGVGLGALLQSQVGAIVTSLVWFLVVEPLLGLPLDDVVDYLPGSALDRLVGVDTSGDAAGGLPTQHAYSLGAAALLVGAYTAGLAVLGTLSALRRDVP
jgi:ABC-2 type transport system permease protein